MAASLCLALPPSASLYLPMSASVALSGPVPVPLLPHSSEFHSSTEFLKSPLDRTDHTCSSRCPAFHWLSVCLSVSLSVYLPLHVWRCLSVCLSIVYLKGQQPG